MGEKPRNYLDANSCVQTVKTKEEAPPSSPKAHVVESTTQEVYPCSSKGKSKAIILKKKVVNIPHPLRKLVQKMKTTNASRDQIPISQEAIPKP
ncbi:unnamed protein product [Prunus armeniaca]